MSKISIISYIVTLVNGQWCFCVLCKQFKEAMLTHLLNYIYNNCKQLLSFREERKEILKITTTWSKETGRIALITIFDFSDFS